jgi:hypothetical protein
MNFYPYFPHLLTVWVKFSRRDINLKLFTTGEFFLLNAGRLDFCYGHKLNDVYMFTMKRYL